MHKLVPEERLWNMSIWKVCGWTGLTDNAVLSLQTRQGKGISCLGSVGYLLQCAPNHSVVDDNGDKDDELGVWGTNVSRWLLLILSKIIHVNASYVLSLDVTYEYYTLIYVFVFLMVLFLLPLTRNCCIFIPNLPHACHMPCPSHSL
jgi:hypothetical protein